MVSMNEIPVRQLKGVSALKEGELHAFGIHTISDLLDYFPFRYEDYRVRELTEVKNGDKATVIGRVCSVPVLQRYGRGKSRLSCKVEVGGLLVTAVWFNRHFLREQLALEREVMLTGKWDQQRRQITVTDSEFPDDRESAKRDTLQPVYSVGGSITQSWMRKAMLTALTQYGSMIEENLPDELVDRHRLMTRAEAVRRLHLPGDTQEGGEARRRMVYEELFLFQLKLQAYRAMNRRRQDGIAIRVDSDVIRGFADTLPFQLTDGQKRAVNEILVDMRRPSGMNRLLQGDVGSGKTVVAAIALYGTVKAGYQGALMVPTEILAEQHARSLQRLFETTGLQVGLLTGSLTEKRRRDLLAGLQMGIINVIVGTHALIQDDVYFHNLGLVVTDEQHRFGVNQRSILRHKGGNPDVLTMTATPIPRTLAITAFGDMDVSTIKEMPHGRKPIKTYWVKHDALDRALGFIRKQVAAGRQAYVICPLIEESEKLEVQNAIDLHMAISGAFPDLRVGLLHGRMTASEKDEVMGSFAVNDTHVLVSTTVVEVGVDVPNATVMIIMDAERFGLSQLHQLRGRVGRGEHQSYCVLVADPKSETGRERMKVMTETNDGFEVARRDLELRGPGDFFGTKQSGLPEFRVADMVSDYEVLELARDDAAELAEREAFWLAGADNPYAKLWSMLRRDPLFQGEQLD
ncbi:ATP-dependent DNA helicase RecG [Paenibacillus sp. J5C_2022]|uniref:ATP-dependent DNA helicase RecG n=1 Tax=Paenibacillus sp. J5C2022 TaxID=2977129 RepID=UPI0021D2D4EB|nr:ATP-dependent DNA helicase RecG [Paenibacillus sp. J5C2022]MCU6708940.1 ATP-dependent DNA helicase RecG [Paenibacillus sp. J5C2022]